QRARRIENRPPPGGGTRRSPGYERLRQGAVTYLKLDTFKRHFERVRRDLGQRCPGTSPDVRGVNAHPVVSRLIHLRERARGKLDGRKRRGGDAGPNEPGAITSRTRPRVTLPPAETLRPFPQACDEVAATEWVSGLGIDRRFVAHAQLDRIEP